VQFLVSDGSVDFKLGDQFTFLTGKGPLGYELFTDLDIADLNNDGKLDMFASSGDEKGISVWTGNGVYGWTLETPPKDSSSYACLSGSVDVNFDGNPDIIAGSESYAGLQLWIGDDIDKYVFSGWLMKAFATGNFYGVATADFNDDHLEDVIAANYEENREGIWMWYGRGAGEFELANAPDAPERFYCVLPVDFNRDGKMDIAAGHSRDGIYVWMSDGATGWEEMPSPTTLGSYWSVDSADFNADGIPDLVGAKDYDGIGTSVQVWLGNGDGTFTTQGVQPIVDADVNFWSVKAIDLNHDQYPDLMATGYSGNGTYIWYGMKALDTGEHVFDRLRVITSSVGWDNNYGLTYADFNTDNQLDIFYTEDGHAATVVYQPGCTAGPDPDCMACGSSIRSYSQFGSGQGRSAASGDFNNDGLNDIVFATLGEGLMVHRPSFNGPGVTPPWTTMTRPTTFGDYIGVAVADLTNDGMPDIVAAHGGSGGIGIEAFLNNRDFAMLEIANTSPGADKEFFITPGAEISFTANKALDPSTITNANISLRQRQPNASDWAPINISITLDASQRTMRIKPQMMMLVHESQLCVRLIGGPAGILDVFGNQLDGNDNGRPDPSATDDYNWCFTALDRNPPAVPANFVAAALDHAALLQWTQNTEPDLAGYWVCWSLQPGIIPMTYEFFYEKDEFGANPFYLINGMQNGTTYYVSVAAMDNYNNVSGYATEQPVTPMGVAPAILMAGYYTSYISARTGGTLNILAYIPDAQRDTSRVEVLYAGIPTGLLLVDDGLNGDFAAGDQVYGLRLAINAGLPQTNFLLSLQATDAAGNQSLIWPYYHSMGCQPLIFQPNAGKPYTYAPVIEPWWSNGQIAGSADAPRIWIAGYMDGVNSDLMGGSFTLIALVQDPQGLEDIDRVMFYYDDIDTTVQLFDDGASGDFAAGDGIYGAQATIPREALAAGTYLIQLKAFDTEGNASDLWPYLAVH